MTNDNSKTLGFATNAIHEAYDNQEGKIRSLNPPIYMTSTFAFNSAEQGAAMFQGEEQGHFYSRISNPTLDILEKRLAKLENAEAGLAFGSGMGAITSICWTFLKAGDEILCDKTLYGCTFAFFAHGLSKFGITITHIDMTDAQNVKQAISEKTKLVYLESPAVFFDFTIKNFLKIPAVLKKVITFSNNANAYSVVRQGNVPEPAIIRKVSDRGRPFIQAFIPHCTFVITPN